MLFVKKGTDYKSIAFATNHTITINLETKETSTKDNGGKWQTSEAGIMSWTANSENLMGNESQGFSYDELFALMIAREPIDVRFALEVILLITVQISSIPYLLAAGNLQPSTMKARPSLPRLPRMLLTVIKHLSPVILPVLVHLHRILALVKHLLLLLLLILLILRDKILQKSHMGWRVLTSSTLFVCTTKKSCK